MARVAVDVSLPHLDRPFDYLVPVELADRARPGCRVRVRFAGREHAGFLLERVPASEHPGRLAPLRRVVSPEPVLDPDVARLARAVADRYAGTLADTLRLAVPARHARVEAEPADPAAAAPAAARGSATGAGPTPVAAGPWAAYPGGAELLDTLAGGGSPRVAWTAGPGEDWPDALARCAAATLASGRGSVLVVADHRDVARLDAACRQVLGADRHVVLTADLGPTARYRAFLRVSRGHARVVVGNRAAAFAPVTRPGLVAVWDDGDDLLAEPRAPYPHAREVLLLRAHQSGAAALVGGLARTAETEVLIRSGWARPLALRRADVRARAPVVHASGADPAELARDPAARAARLPRRAFEVARAGLTHGPVLVQVPRAGYLPGLVCDRCRTPARCATCAGPLARVAAGGAVACRWCGRTATAWRCAECGHERWRAPVVGAERTAEELGRAFPGVRVRTSMGARTLQSVPAVPALVVATPGAEPPAPGGYAAALLLDGWLLLSRADLRAAEEALRRWLTAAGLVVPAASGGAVVVMAEPSATPVQALVRWDPAGHAARELADRRTAELPPAVRLAVVDGAAAAVAELAAVLDVPPDVAVLGPVAVTDEQSRLLLRAPRQRGRVLAERLHAAQAVLSARKAGNVRVRVDPVVLG